MQTYVGVYQLTNVLASSVLMITFTVLFNSLFHKRHLVPACADNCYNCTNRGAGKCDNGQCFPRYALVVNDQNCGGMNRCYSI